MGMTLLYVHMLHHQLRQLRHKEESNIQIQLGLPHNIRALVNNQCTEFQVPPYSDPLAELIVSKSIDFEGDPLINARDLQELEGKATNDEAKWITNFIVDSYLQLVKTTSAEKGLCIEVFGWKNLKKQWKRNTWKIFWKAKMTRCSFLSLQWYSEKTLVRWSDVSPGNVHCGAWQPVREIHRANCVKWVEKMVSLPVDQSIDINQWSFFSNRPGEIPQQDNNMTVVFSLVCMQDVWPPDAKWSLKLKFQHTGNYWSKNCTRKGYAQSHNQLFNQGNNMQLITSKTIILAE